MSKEFIINRDFHDVRLDKFLRKTYRDIPLSGIFRMIRKGRVKVNRKKKKQDYRLQEGDLVRVWEESAPAPLPPPITLSKEEERMVRSAIVFEDGDLLICNKPAGLVMHVGSEHAHGLTEMVRAYTRNPTFNFVHRIDKMTMGLVMGGKHPSSIRKLSGLIREHAMIKDYVIVVEGIPEEDHFSLVSFLKKEEERVTEQGSDEGGGKEARSDFALLKRGRKRSLLQARLHTGRTHQLRVQLANIGLPIVGDRKYGAPVKETTMFLFSQHLSIPSLNLDVSLPVPDAFYKALQG